MNRWWRIHVLGLLVIYFGVLPPCAQGTDPQVTEISVAQQPGSGLVSVTYNLWTENGLPAAVSSVVSLDGGATWTVTPTTVTGSHGLSVSPGTGRSFIWDAEADLPNILVNSAKFKLTACQTSATQDTVLVPAGQFMMGQFGTIGVPEHSVTLIHSFQLGRTEVTNAQFMEALNWAKSQGLVSVVGDYVQQYGVDLLQINQSGQDSYEIRYNAGTQQFYLHAGTYISVYGWGPGIAFPGGNYDPSNHPVKYVSWYGAACYCDWRSQMENLPRYYEGQWSQIPSPRNPYTATGYRLPTEAEWEFAAQHDDERTYPWGSTTPTCTLANYNPNSGYCVGWTSPVGTHPAGASALGLQDMAGNVWEWCNDWYASYSSGPQSNPAGPASGSVRIKRGGPWASGASALTCAYHSGGYPTDVHRSNGFRLCRTLP